MFCCRPKLSEEEGRVLHEEGEPAKHPRHVAMDGTKVVSRYGKTHVKTDTDNFWNIMDKSAKIPRPKVDHVRSVHDNVYVKLSSLGPRNSLIRDKHQYYVNIDRNYNMVGISPRKTRASVSRSHSCHYTDVSIPRAALNVNRSLSYRVQPTNDTHRVTAQFMQISDHTHSSTPNVKKDKHTFKSQSYGNEPNVETDNGTQNDSFTKEQNDVLEQLDDTIKEFNVSDLDDITPKIVADVLPYGVFEVDEKFDSGLESDETPSSRTSSLSSNKSLTSKSGIITSSRGKRERRVPSVSFNLPPDHVDKPYQPMQSHRSKTVQAPTQIYHTFTITDYKSKVWHTNTEKAFVEDKVARRSSGPFKGSFKQLFYGKYAPKEHTPQDDGLLQVSPMIKERVNSFESLRDIDSKAPIRSNSWK